MKTSVPLRLFTALLLVVGADMAGPATRAGAYSVTFNTMQHNVRFTHIDSIKLMATNNAGLWVITGQELCRNEYTSINQYLTAQGYHVWGYAEADWGHSNAACAGTDGAIDMVASRGSATLLQRAAFADQNYVKHSVYVHYGWVCLEASANPYSWRACSGHAEAHDANVAMNNALELKNIGLFINDRPVMIGADLNRRPLESGPSSFYTSFDEVDQNGPAAGSSGDVRGAFTFSRFPFGTPYKKLDYIFSIKLRMTPAFGVAVVPNQNPNASDSDHTFIYGYNQM